MPQRSVGLLTTPAWASCAVYGGGSVHPRAAVDIASLTGPFPGRSDAWLWNSALPFDRHAELAGQRRGISGF